jgi:hypothetical protein
MSISIITLSYVRMLILIDQGVNELIKLKNWNIPDCEFQLKIQVIHLRIIFAARKCGI